MGNEGKRVGLLCDTLVFFGVDGGAKRLLSSYSFDYTIHDQRRGKKKKKRTLIGAVSTGGFLDNSVPRFKSQ